MRDFAEIFSTAAERKGGPEELAKLLEPALGRNELATIPDDRWLAQFTKSIFQSGFNWKAIESKWDGFEEAFHGFDVGRCAFMNDEWFDELVTNKQIVRNGTKILSVRDNAIFLVDLAKEYGSAGAFFANWPATDYIGPLAEMKQRGSRLGAAAAQYSLRFMGVDGFILSRDVVARLTAEGIIDKAPTSKRALNAVQGAFNKWAAESGLGLKEISRVLAFSIA